MTPPFEWRVRAEAADETDAAIVAEVLAGAIRDERNNPDEPVEVAARPSARSAILIVPTDRDTEVPVTNSSPDYRSTVRETLSRMSDEALRFQDARVAGGIDREELDAEIARRAASSPRETVESLRASLRTGWFLREGTSKAPRDHVVLEQGLDTTTAVRRVVAVVPDAAETLAQLRSRVPEAFEAAPTLCDVHEAGACPEGCPDAYDLDEEPEPPTLSADEIAARERQQTLLGAARGLVALARSLHVGDGDPMDDLVLALARSSGGPYALLSAVFRLLDSEEELDAEKRLANWTSYGTETQYALMRRVARGVVGDANGARETFADILHATSERAGGHPPVRLAEERRDGLVSISERPNIWSHRRAARAEAIAAGATYDEASDAWTAAASLDHPKGGRS